MGLSHPLPFVYVWLALATTLSGGFWAEGVIDILNCAHGGFIQFGASGVGVKGRSIKKCGRPAAMRGSSIWGFGGGISNRVEFDFADDGYSAIILDNKTFGVAAYGLIGSETRGIYRIGEVKNHLVSSEISTGTDNLIIFERMSSSATMPSFDNWASSNQTVTAINAQRNVVEIRNFAGTPAANGVNKTLNTVIVNGMANFYLLQGSATYDPGSLAAGAATAIQTLAVAGAALGDAVTAASFSINLAGAELVAWVSATDTVSYYFRNINGADPLDLASGTVAVTVRKAM